MSRLRKNVTMLVTVSVPSSMTAADARREVRTLIKYQNNYSAGPDDVKPIRVEAASVPTRGRASHDSHGD